MTKYQRKITDYIRAFTLFTSGDHLFHARAAGQHALVNDGIYIYRVSHFDDLMSDYENIFRYDNKGIYTNFPAALWDCLLKEKVNLNVDDFSIDLYEAWKRLGDPGSLTDFNRLIDRFHNGPDQLISQISELDEALFLPVVARAISRQYSPMEEFFADCVRYMTTKFTDQLGDGQVFVRVKPEADPDTQAYFIYTVDEDF